MSKRVLVGRFAVVAVRVLSIVSAFVGGLSMGHGGPTIKASAQTTPPIFGAPTDPDAHHGRANTTNSDRMNNTNY